MTIRAFGSAARISRAAWRPSFTFMVMSMVTRSGFSCMYFVTASAPLVASPQIWNPRGVNVSLTIMRMKFASSTTRTLLAILPSSLGAKVSTPFECKQRANR